MKSLLILAIVLLVCSLFLTKNKIESEENILVLNSKNFYDALNTYNYLLVNFYEPGCFHCEATETECNKAADFLIKENSEIRLAKFDISLNPKLAKKLKIESSPVLKYYVNQTTIGYDGSGEANDLIGWLKKKALPNPAFLHNLDDYKKLRNDHDLLGLGLFKNLESQSVLTFKNISNSSSFEQVMFSITSNQDLFNELNIESDEAFVLFRKFNQDYVKFEKSFSLENLEKFLKINRLPDVIEFNILNMPMIFESNYPYHNLLFVSKRNKKYSSIMEQFRIAAKHYKEKVLFVLIDTDSDKNKQTMKSLRVELQQTPTYRLLNPVNMLRFKPVKNEFNSKYIIKFVQDALDKKIKPDLASENLPKDWNEKAVKTLVGLNFEEIVKDKTKSVLVLFYATWDEKCKETLPILEKLAFNFKDKSEYLVAKIDCTLNEFEEFKISDIPTIKIFPKNSNEFIIFNGNATVEKLTLFLESHGKKGNGETPKKEEL